MNRRRGFTLIEILVVVAIIGLLIGILAPSLGAARRVSKATKCKHNLHEIAVGIKAYLDVNRETFPMACRGSEATPPVNRPRLPKALWRELGRDSDVFECPSDKVTGSNRTPDMKFDRYFENYGTSYEWEDKQLSGNKINHQSVTFSLRLPNGQTMTVTRLLREVMMVFDFEGWHRDDPKRKGSINILYADLRVDSDNIDAVANNNNQVRPINREVPH